MVHYRRTKEVRKVPIETSRSAKNVVTSRKEKRPPKQPTKHLIIRVRPDETPSGRNYWSAKTFRKRYAEAFDQIELRDWLFIDFSSKDDQLQDNEALSNLAYIILEVCEDKKGRLGLMVNNRDERKIEETDLDNFVTLFLSEEEKDQSFRRSNFIKIELEP